MTERMKDKPKKPLSELLKDDINFQPVYEEVKHNLNPTASDIERFYNKNIIQDPFGGYPDLRAEIEGSGDYTKRALALPGKVYVSLIKGLDIEKQKENINKIVSKYRIVGLGPKEVVFVEVEKAADFEEAALKMIINSVIKQDGKKDFSAPTMFFSESRLTADMLSKIAKENGISIRDLRRKLSFPNHRSVSVDERGVLGSFPSSPYFSRLVLNKLGKVDERFSLVNMENYGFIAKFDIEDILGGINIDENIEEKFGKLIEDLASVYLKFGGTASGLGVIKVKTKEEAIEFIKTIVKNTFKARIFDLVDDKDFKKKYEKESYLRVWIEAKKGGYLSKKEIDKFVKTKIPFSFTFTENLDGGRYEKIFEPSAQFYIEENEKGEKIVNLLGFTINHTNKEGIHMGNSVSKELNEYFKKHSEKVQILVDYVRELVGRFGYKGYLSLDLMLVKDKKGNVYIKIVEVNPRTTGATYATVSYLILENHNEEQKRKRAITTFNTWKPKKELGINSLEKLYSWIGEALSEKNIGHDEIEIVPTMYNGTFAKVPLMILGKNKSVVIEALKMLIDNSQNPKDRETIDIPVEVFEKEK